MLRPRPRQALRAAGTAAAGGGTGCWAAREHGEWPRSRPARARAGLTHPHMHTFALAPHCCHDPTKTAATTTNTSTTTTKTFSTFAPSPSLLPPSCPSTLNPQTRRRVPVNWRARPPSLLCRPSSLVVSSPRRYAASHTMANEWTGIKVRKTFFDFFAERGHNIGM